jgi:DNA-binding transcriptional LysR family regulator
MGPDTQAAKLAKGEVHLGFTAAPFPSIDKLERFELHRLLRSPLVVLLNPRHPLAGREAVSLRDLRKDLFIDFQMHRPQAYRLWATSICKHMNFKPEFGPAAENPENMIDMVAANQGIALVPKLTLRQFSGGVVVIPIADQELEFELFAMWDPNFPSVLLKNFLKIVLAEAETVQRALYSDSQGGNGAVMREGAAAKRSQKRNARSRKAA